MFFQAAEAYGRMGRRADEDGRGRQAHELPASLEGSGTTLPREACLIYSYLTGTYGFRATQMCALRVAFRARRVSAEGSESPDKGTESERKGNG